MIAHTPSRSSSYATYHQPEFSTAPAARPSSSQCITRSPKRAKSTPSPIELNSSISTSASSSSHRPRHRPQTSRPAMNGREGLFDRCSSSPWIHASGSEGFAARQAGSLQRRREMSVPLLSRTLSNISLNQVQSPDSSAGPMDKMTTSIPFNIPSPPVNPTATPRRLPSDSSFTINERSHRDQTHSSTAPSAHASLLLGSPFSTKQARGGYHYHSLSPSRGPKGGNYGHQSFSPMGGWMGGSEWMVEEELTEDEYRQSLSSVEHSRSDLHDNGGRLRRDVSGSTSSFEDYSGSGASSTSLFSLARSSGEQHVRSDLSVWEDVKNDVHLASHTDSPSMPMVLSSEGMVEDAVKMGGRAQTSPSTSPLIGRRRNTKQSAEGQVSPLQSFLMARTPSATSPTAVFGSPASVKRSSLAFIPRLLSTSKSKRKSRNTPPCAKLQIVQSAATTTGLREPAHNLSAHPAEIAPRPRDVLQIELDSPASLVRKVRLPMSPSSECEPSDSSSPPRPPALLASSTSTGTSNLSSSPVPTASASRLARRKTLGGDPKKYSPNESSRSGPLRPHMRRGITEPQRREDSAGSAFLSPAHAALSTPVATLFGDVRPSPAAFASTGLVKKRSTNPGGVVPRFGDSEPPKASAQISPTKPIKSRLGLVSAAPVLSGSTSTTSTDTNPGSDGSVSVYVRAAQKTRGLRRKTSNMFGSNGSTGNSVDLGSSHTSPSTPTKPGGAKAMSFGLGITTPSPTSASNMTYPFALGLPASSRTSPNNAFHPGSATDTSPLAERIGYRPHLLRNRPIARASNPMLAASFRAQDTKSRASSLKSGNRLIADFTIVQPLGRGEFSQVWKVREKASGTFFAIKAGKPYTGYKNRLRQLEEVSILRQLSQDPHPNVITFYDSWEHDSRLYIRTELAPCGDLSTFLLSVAEKGGLGEMRAWKTLMEVTNGLAHIHKHDFLHLDLKPSNILITAEGSLQIADFGMSTVKVPKGFIGGVSPALPTAVDGEFVWRDEKMTVPSPIIDREIEGDREYLCPEALGDGPIGPEADVFSLGILLLEAALNVVLPPNGEGWVKLRNDDFGDLEGHYTLRTALAGADETVPVLSGTLVALIKEMMLSDPTSRMTLDQVMLTEPMIRLRSMETSGALVEESEELLEELLG